MPKKIFHVIFYKTYILLFIISIFLSNCTTTYKVAKTNRSDLLDKFIKKYDKTFLKCMAWEINGIMHVISNREGFRGNFSLKGNDNFPWIMEIKWGFGSLVSMTKIEKKKITSFNVKENRVYVYNNPLKIFKSLGIEFDFSPEFCLNLLTGKWKKIINVPKRNVILDKGVEYFLDDPYIEKIFIGFDLNRWTITLKNGLILEGLGENKITIKDDKAGTIYFRVKQKSCKKKPFGSNELVFIIPKNVKVFQIN